MSEPIKDMPLFDASELSEFRARLINKGKFLDEAKVDEERQNFIKQILLPRDEFITWFKDRFPLGEPDEVTCQIPENTLCEGELADPPLDTEKSLSEILADIPPRQAALPAFWASYNIKLLERGIIEEPAHLAKPIGSGATSTGRNSLEQAQKKEATSERDRCVRTLCRQLLGGIPEERGQVSVYIDPRIARAWWRGHIARQAHEDLELDLDEVWATLRQAGAPWEELVQHMVRKLTHVGERPIRSALVARLVKMKKENDAAGGVSDSRKRREETADLLAAAGRRTAQQSLGVLSASEVLKVLEKAGEPIS